jgi:DNA replication and repair protein RecF
VVLISGANGAGKTNLLEALHMGTQGFSPRARSDAQLVRFGADEGKLRTRGLNTATSYETDIVLSANGSRLARFNGSDLRSAEQLRYELRTLVFTPDRLAVVKGGPATRRAYVDRSLGRLFPSRAPLSVEYAAVVGQRNAALRRVAVGATSADAVTPWTEAVTTLGRALVEARMETIALLASDFTSCAGSLGLAAADVSYEGEAVSTAEYDARLERDLERGITGLGPHLHDVRLEAGGKELRSFGSQGEQRVAVLALVLAEARALVERTGARPLVLLDDVLSELDGDRRAALSKLIADGGQTLVTATATTALPIEPAQSLVVSSGSVRSV